MYAEQLRIFENAENLGGKAWQHAANIDLLKQINIKDCSLHCFHYQQMFEMLFKHILEIKSEDNLHIYTHKLNNLLENLIKYTNFKTDKNKYHMTLSFITVCAGIYRYDFSMECNVYYESVKIADELLKELLIYITE